MMRVGYAGLQPWGTAVGEYMYTMCMAGGMVSALEDDGDRVGWRVMWVVDCLRGDCC